MDNLCEELGDFLYLIIMLAEINESEGHFSMTDVVMNINEKPGKKTSARFWKQHAYR